MDLETRFDLACEQRLAIEQFERLKEYLQPIPFTECCQSLVEQIDQHLKKVQWHLDGGD